MFTITGEKGFHITFENGWTISVQFGPGNYCDNYDRQIGRDEKESGSDGSTTAECAIFNPDRDLIEHPDFEGNTVCGYKKANEVLELINWTAKQST